MASADKAAQRAELRAARARFVHGLTAVERARLEAQAAAKLMPLIAGARVVAFYHAIGDEFGCAPAMAAAAAAGIRLALPHVHDRAGAMRFLHWAPGDRLDAGWRGLLQPVADSPTTRPDIVVTPLLGFDSSLQRLGQGAGFYDRAFADLPHVKKIGWGWSVQQLARIACDPWDVPLDAVVTEAGTIGG